MRLLVFLVVAVGWGSAQADHYGMPAPNSLDRNVEKREFFFSRRFEEGDLDFNGEPTGDLFVRSMLKTVFGMQEWRDLMVSFATRDELANPEFRSKWHITENEIVNAGNNNYPERVRDQLRRLLRSRKWRGLIALSSSKAELIDVNYREKWGLGPLENRIKYSSETGNFFHGPQWKQFLAITETNKEFPDPQVRAKWLKKWILSAMQMMTEL